MTFLSLWKRQNHIFWASKIIIFDFYVKSEWSKILKISTLLCKFKSFQNTQTQVGQWIQPWTIYPNKYHFSNATKVDKLIEYLSLEEHKGHDRFDARRFIMFKGLFRNHGDAFMELFKGHLERLVDQDQESAHRYILRLPKNAISSSNLVAWKVGRT